VAEVAEALLIRRHLLEERASDPGFLVPPN
jgi:hypothetical protein